jgi:hypothetical protein
MDPPGNPFNSHTSSLPLFDIASTVHLLFKKRVLVEMLTLIPIFDTKVGRGL